MIHWVGWPGIPLGLPECMLANLGSAVADLLILYDKGLQINGNNLYIKRFSVTRLTTRNKMVMMPPARMKSAT